MLSCAGAEAWWLERPYHFLFWGCSASPLSVLELEVTPLRLMLSTRCVRECIFGHLNDNFFFILINLRLCDSLMDIIQLVSRVYPHESTLVKIPKCWIWSSRRDKVSDVWTWNPERVSMQARDCMAGIRSSSWLCSSSQRPNSKGAIYWKKSEPAHLIDIYLTQRITLCSPAVMLWSSDTPLGKWCIHGKRGRVLNLLNH